MRGLGYRNATEFRGEYIAHADRSVTNTLHTVEVWERDRSAQPSINTDDLEDENAQREADEFAELSADW
jgi:hypothetical protein